MKNILYIIAAGLLYGVMATLSYEPFNIWILSWVFMIPIFACAYRFRNSVMSLIGSGIICTTMLNICASHWLFKALELSLNIGKLYSTILFGIYILTSSLRNVVIITALGLAIRHYHKKYVFINWLTIGFAGAIIDEYTPSYIPWAWGNLAVSSEYLIQIVEYTGVCGLSLIVIAGNYYLFEGILYLIAKRERKGARARTEKTLLEFLSHKSILYWTSLPAFIIGIVFIGMLRVSQIDNELNQGDVVHLAALQTNSPLSDVSKMYELRDQIFRVIDNTIPMLSKKAVQSIKKRLDIVILPESAVPFASTNDSSINRKWGLYSEPYHKMVKNIARTYGMEVFLGELDIEEDKKNPKNERGILHNSSVLFSRKGTRVESYDKGMLFPVSEYMPLNAIIKSIGLHYMLPEVLQNAQFAPGKEKTVIPYTRTKTDGKGTETGHFMPLICYEILFPSYIRGFFKEKGKLPEFIVNITQDGWFGKSIATYQHMAFARIRAVETRRAIVRSTTTGVSVAYGSNGRIIEPIYGDRMTKRFKRTLQVWALPIIKNEMTIYVKYGNMWMLIVGVIIAGGMLVEISRDRKRKDHKTDV